LPITKVIAAAADLAVPVRIYVPYGAGYLPYAISQIWRKPQIVWWLAKDVVASVFSCSQIGQSVRLG
jgi:hypothetical protein